MLIWLNKTRPVYFPTISICKILLLTWSLEALFIALNVLLQKSVCIFHNKPVSDALCITSFWICLNLGCAASGAKPSITDSEVVKKAPTSLNLSSANLRSVIDLDEQQSTTTWTSIPRMKILQVYQYRTSEFVKHLNRDWAPCYIPWSISSNVVWCMHACVSIPQRMTDSTSGLLSIE